MDQIDLSEAALHVVVSFIEPLTRFGKADLSDVKGSSEFIGLTANQSFIVNFTTEHGSGNGRLPSGVGHCSNATAMQAELDRTIAAARKQLPERLANWQTAKGLSSTAQVNPNDCYVNTPPIGYDYPCDSCGGSGAIVCSSCHGRARVQCYTCGGSQRVQCGTCKGSGYATCSTCLGRGSYWEQQQRTVWDSVSKTKHVEYFHVSRACQSCGGQGKYRCGRCSGSGKLACMTCFGRGDIACNTCGETGKVNCTTCAATGWQFRRAQVVCGVTENFMARAPQNAHDEVKAFVAGMRKIEILCGLAPMAVTSSKVDTNTLERFFSGELLVTTLSLNAVGTQIGIWAFGNPPRIFDFKNIVGVLLQKDLEALKQALTEASVWPWRSNAMLERPLAEFLKSEANVRIGQLARKVSGQASLARDEFRMAVSTEYAVEAASCMRRGLGHLYRNELFPGIVAVLVLPLLMLTLVRVVWPGYMDNFTVLLGAITVGATTGYGWERRSVSKVSARLGPSVGGYVGDLLSCSGSKLRWRQWVGSVMVLITVVVWANI